MSLEETVIPINFGQGIETKTDPKLVMPGKFIQLRDAVFPNAKRATKRNGYDLIESAIMQGTTLASPVMVKAFNGELTAADLDTKSLYSFSDEENFWVNKGAYYSVGVNKDPISTAGLSTIGITNTGNTGELMQSSARAGNIVLFCWANYDQAAGGYETYATVRDISTGVDLLSSTGVTGTVPAGLLSCGKAVCIGGTQLGIIYVASNLHLTIALLNISPSSGVFFTLVDIGSDEVAYTLTGSYKFIQYDYETVASGLLLAYSGSASGGYGGTANTIYLKKLNTSGGVSAFATISSAGKASPLTTKLDPSTGNWWIYWFDSSAGNLMYAIYDSSLSVVLSKTVLTGFPTIIDMAASPISSIQQELVYSVRSTHSPLTNDNLTSLKLALNGSSAVGTFFVNGMEIASKVFAVAGFNYILCRYSPSVSDTSQNTMFLFSVDQSPGTAVAKSLYGECAILDPYIPAYLNQVVSLSSTKVGIFSSFEIQKTTSVITGTPISTQLLGGVFIYFDFDHQDAYQSVLSNGVVVLGGGLVSMYDGASVYELGFNQFPEVFPATISPSGGLIGAGTYNYYATYEGYDAKGNFYQSAPSVPLSVSVTGGASSLTVPVRVLSVTQRGSVFPTTSVTVSLYRTSANTNTATLLYSQENVKFAEIVTFSDVFSDATIAGNNALYTNGGVLENIAPPPALLLQNHTNRLWLIDSENPNAAWYSKTFQPTIGISMTDLMQEQVDSRFGASSALVEMDDKILVFKQTGMFYIAGDGVNDVGANSTLSTPQFIPSDVGCTESKGAISMPSGIIFKSAKGFYLVDRALSVSYIGADVQGFNDQNCTSALRDYSKTQVRFLTSSGESLVYDYFFNQWSTFTNHQGYSADIWDGLYVYARTDGAIYKENPLTFLDNTTAYGMLAKTAWLKLSSVQSFERVRRMALLGDYQNGTSAAHGVQISAAYDFGTLFSAPIPYVFGASGASGVVEYRERLPQQKCGAIQLLIQETTTGASGEFFDITDLSFEAALKKGINKLPAGQSVG